MIALDTNLLVRYLVADHREQAEAVRALLAGLTADRPGFVCREEPGVPETDALREAFRFEVEPHGILSRVGEPGEPGFEPEHEENPRVVAEGDAGIPPFDAVEGRAAQHRPLRHERGRDAAPPSSVAEVTAQLAERTEGRERQGRVASRWHCVLNTRLYL